MIDRLLKSVTIWLWGGFLYVVIEVLWRGYSHAAMFAVGGACFLLIGGINAIFPWGLGFVWQALIGGAAVTAVELVSGLILNRWLGWGVWDYSRTPFNFMGQICLQYSLGWIGLAAVGVLLDDYLRWKLFNDRKPQYKLF